MIVRREQPGDRAAVRAVHTAAFPPPPGGDGGPVEARLVDELRADGDVLPALCLVAVAAGEVVGSVVCSWGTVSGGGSHLLPGLGPLGVLPAHQGRGVGSALVHAVLGAADALGVPAVVLLGDPGYYGRFGFVTASGLGVTPPEPAWAEHFQIRPLAAWDGSVRGTFTYAAAFGRL